MESSASERSAPTKFALVRFSDVIVALVRLAWGRLACVKFALNRYAAVRLEFERFAFVRLALPRYACVKLRPEITAPGVTFKGFTVRNRSPNPHRKAFGKIYQLWYLLMKDLLLPAKL